MLVQEHHVYISKRGRHPTSVGDVHPDRNDDEPEIKVKIKFEYHYSIRNNWFLLMRVIY